MKTYYPNSRPMFWNMEIE